MGVPDVAAVAQNDLNYYVPRTDPGGPSMSDAINSIDTAALGTPGCASYVYTQRSIEPFIRDVFDQFSETRTGGAFTFMTGIGGFLQEFLYGYSGLRWNATAVQLDPSLTSQLGGVVLHDLSWRGRRFTVSIGPRTTTVTLNHGPAMPVTVRGHRRSVRAGAPADDRHPPPGPDPDRRCGPLRRRVGLERAARRPPLAAVDGSPATDWQPTSLPATLTVPLRARRAACTPRRSPGASRARARPAPTSRRLPAR